MDLSLFQEFVSQYGYIAMFLFNWLLLFGLPIPNELAASLSGYITVTEQLNSYIAFSMVYLGLISATLFAFTIGKSIGPKLLERLHKVGLQTSIHRFDSFFNKYGRRAIAFSFFIPGIRFVMPYVVGSRGISYKAFLWYTLLPAFIWSTIYFQLGKMFPNAYETIVTNVRWAIAIILITVAIILLIRYTKNKQ